MAAATAVAADRMGAEVSIPGEEVTEARDLLAKAVPNAAVIAVNRLEDRKKEDRKQWVGARIAGPKPDAARDYPKIIHRISVRRTCAPLSMMASGTRSGTPKIRHEAASRLVILEREQEVGTRSAEHASVE
jgi:hypothetical protein